VLLPTDGAWGGGFRLNAAPTVRLATDDETRVVRIDGLQGAPPVAVRVGDVVHLDLAGRSTAFRLAPPPDVDRAASAAATHATGRMELRAPMPGQVLSIGAAAGTTVAAGDAVVTLEAMKMEHAVIAPAAGRVDEVRVQVGDQVQRGQVLAIVEPG
jgi:biotin carboxyl carrier protein